MMLNREFPVDPTLTSLLTHFSTVAQALRGETTVHNVTTISFDSATGPPALMFMRPTLVCQVVKPYFICSDPAVRECMWGTLPYPAPMSFVNVQDTPKLAIKALTRYCSFEHYKLVVK